MSQTLMNDELKMSVVTVEVFSAPHCNRCQKARQQLKVLLSRIDNNVVELRELNVVEHLDYAVQLGVLTTPSVAINGELIFASIPSEKQLRQALLQYETHLSESKSIE